MRDVVGPDTTIIIITAYDWCSIEKSAREARVDAFLAKPIYASALYNALLSVTGIEKVVHVPQPNQQCVGEIRQGYGNVQPLAGGLRRLSDRVCIEYDLSHIQSPKPHSQGRFLHHSQPVDGGWAAAVLSSPAPRRYCCGPGTTHRRL